ncbi:MAG: RNA polymerase sigma factor [Elusimicrobiota bacterium]|nr:RNA polymerase sigma factor [Elusimicrobiota bacterium]
MDDAEFEALVREHSPRVRALCAAVLKDATEADDAAQDAFLKAHRSLSGWARESSFGTWVHRIAVNVCLDRLRAAARRKADSLEALGERDAAALRTLVEPSATGALEDRDLAHRLLARLTPETRLAFTLCERDGLSYAEIAEAMSCTVDSVKSRIKRARAELAEAARHFSRTGGV